MVNYSLSEKADADIEDIYEYGLLTFGLSQAQTYLLELHERFQMLSENPNYGRSASHLAERLKRFEYQSHVIFYVPQDSGILIVRVLRQERDFIKYF